MQFSQFFQLICCDECETGLLMNCHFNGIINYSNCKILLIHLFIGDIFAGRANIICQNEGKNALQKTTRENNFFPNEHSKKSPCLVTLITYLMCPGSLVSLRMLNRLVTIGTSNLRLNLGIFLRIFVFVRQFGGSF